MPAPGEVGLASPVASDAAILWIPHSVKTNWFRFSLAEMLILTTAIVVLAAEAQAVGMWTIAFAVLATGSVLTVHRRLRPSPLVLLLGMPVLVLLIVLLLLPDVQ
jgi:hypothetical protein